MSQSPPTRIQLHRRSAVLEIAYGDESSYKLSAEFLRVHSPSAEVKGHGRGQETLQKGKRKVAISNLEVVGNYAIKLIFDDGHDTGIYSWDYLKELGEGEKALWKKYLQKLRDARASRDPLPEEAQVITIQPLKPAPSAK